MREGTNEALPGTSDTLSLNIAARADQQQPDAFHRELQLLGSVPETIPSELNDRIDDARNNKDAARLIGESFVVGAALTLATKNPESFLGALQEMRESKAVKAIKVLAGIDVLGRIGVPMADTLVHPDNLEKDKQNLRHNVGAWLFYCPLIGISAGLGAGTISLGAKLSSFTPLAMPKDELAVRQALALDKSTPPGTLSRLSLDPDARVRQAVAGNTSIPPVALERLWFDPDPKVSLAAVKNDYTPTAALSRLGMKGSTPPDLLIALSRHLDANVRGAVAWNHSTPPDILARLAGDNVAAVREAVAWNEHTPKEVLARLTSDEVPEVGQAAKWNASTPAQAPATP